MKKPFVIVYAEVSADGKTSHCRGCSSKTMMGFEDADVRRFRHEIRARAEAIMVGSNTIRTDDPSLTVRDVQGRNPLRVVPASSGDLPENSKILNDAGKTLIAVSAAASQDAVAALERKGATVVRAGSTQVDLAALLSDLADRGVSSLVVEGGASLLASLFRNRLVDRLIVQHLPVVFGGDNVPSMVGGSALKSLDDAIRLRLVETRTVGAHAVIIYDVV
ncbi:MAG TPA: dihydrofolate reductase family protein [Steroidobacteraceae bacterium]